MCTGYINVTAHPNSVSDLGTDPIFPKNQKPGASPAVTTTHDNNDNDDDEEESEDTFPPLRVIVCIPNSNPNTHSPYFTPQPSFEP